MEAKMEEFERTIEGPRLAHPHLFDIPLLPIDAWFLQIRPHNLARRAQASTIPLCTQPPSWTLANQTGTLSRPGERHHMT